MALDHLLGPVIVRCLLDYREHETGMSSDVSAKYLRCALVQNTACYTRLCRRPDPFRSPPCEEA